MNVKSVAINSFAKFMIGGLVFNKIKDIVLIYNTSDLTGPQKREQAFKDVLDILSGVSNWVIGLGIELAVAYFKTLDQK